MVAVAGDVTFLGNPKYTAALKNCRATAVLVAPDFAEEIPPLAIRVENPSLAFSKVVEKFAPAPIQRPPGVHPTAVIGNGVQLGEGVYVGPCVVIEDGVQIGARCVINAHTFIGQ